MEEKNNFKEISEHVAPPRRVKTEVRRSLINMRFVGDLVDLYLVKPMDLLIRPPKNVLENKKDK